MNADDFTAEIVKMQSAFTEMLTQNFTAIREVVHKQIAALQTKIDDLVVREIQGEESDAQESKDEQVGDSREDTAHPGVPNTSNSGPSAGITSTQAPQLDTSTQVLDLQGVPVLVCQTKLGDRDHRSKKILSKDPYPEMNRLASRRM